jgi:Kef-type K+ transport systems, membrane components
MSVTAFPVLARILTDRNMHRTRIGSIALASAATDDALAWSLLAVVAAIAGAGSQQFRLLLVPVYAGVMFGLVRPLLRRLVDVYRRRGGSRPTFSRWCWPGCCCPLCHRLDGPEVHLRRLPFRRRHAPGGGRGRPARGDPRSPGQVSVLVLLPVFFVVSGLSVNLSSVGLSGLVELCLILLVAVVGKFGGAFAGARIAGVRGRRAGVLATLSTPVGSPGS